MQNISSQPYPLNPEDDSEKRSHTCAGAFCLLRLSVDRKLRSREKDVSSDSGGLADGVTDPPHRCAHVLHSSAHKLDDDGVCLLLHHTRRTDTDLSERAESS